MPLSRHFHVYAIDLIWHGLSSKPPFSMDTIPTFVEQVIDFMDAAGIDRAHLEGESLGGWVGGWLAIQHPERLRRLVLNTMAGWHPQGVAETAPGLAERSMAAVRNPDRETIRKRLEWLVADPARMPDEMVEIRYRIYTEPETNQALQQLFHAHLVDQTPRRKYGFTEADLGRITVPTLVLWSEHNPGPGPTWPGHRQQDSGRAVCHPGRLWPLAAVREAGGARRDPHPLPARPGVRGHFNTGVGRGPHTMYSRVLKEALAGAAGSPNDRDARGPHDDRYRRCRHAVAAERRPARVGGTSLGPDRPRPSGEARPGAYRHP